MWLYSIFSITKPVIQFYLFIQLSYLYHRNGRRQQPGAAVYQHYDHNHYAKNERLKRRGYFSSSINEELLLISKTRFLLWYLSIQK